MPGLLKYGNQPCDLAFTHVGRHGILCPCVDVGGVVGRARLISVLSWVTLNTEIPIPSPLEEEKARRNI